MKIVVASEGSGFELKETLKQHLKALGHEVLDVGKVCVEDESICYVDAGVAAGEAVSRGKAERAIVVCGSGAGVCIAANKVKGIRCMACESIYAASRAAKIVNANAIAIGACIVGAEMACEMAEAFIADSFLDGFNTDKKQDLSSMAKALESVEKKNFK